MQDELSHKKLIMDERDRTVAEIMIEMANGARQDMTQMPATGKLSETLLPDNSKPNAVNGNIHLLPPLNKGSCDKRKREKEDFPQDEHKLRRRMP